MRKHKTLTLEQIETCPAEQVDVETKLRFCYFSGEACCYKQKPACPDYNRHIKYRISPQ